MNCKELNKEHLNLLDLHRKTFCDLNYIEPLRIIPISNYYKKMQLSKSKTVLKLLLGFAEY